jgi:hypothetical protein
MAIETIRIFFGWKANLTESLTEMALSIGLFVLGVLGVLYLLIWCPCYKTLTSSSSLTLLGPML